MRHAALLAALTLAAMPAAAAVVVECDTPVANARNLARPVAENVREFSNGEVVLLQLLLDEPACCGAHLMVLWPDPEVGYARCALVTTEDGVGWSGLAMVDAQASYDPEQGLAVPIPGQRWAAEADTFLPFRLDVTLNRAEGAVAAEESFGTDE
jgi:hypothetical protein